MPTLRTIARYLKLPSLSWGLGVGFFLLILLATTGCERRPLWVYRGGYAKLHLKVDWKLFEEETPTGFTAIFYPREAGRQPLTVISANIDGTDVNLPMGTYDIVLFNQIQSEYSNEEFRGMDAFYTSEVALLPLLQQPASNAALYGPRYSRVVTRAEVFESPEPMALDTLHGLIVSEDMVEHTSLIHYEDRHKYTDRFASDTIYMNPRSIVWKLRVDVHVKGIANFRSIRGSVFGLAEGYWLGRFRQNTTAIYHTFETWAGTRTRGSEEEDGILSAELGTFGMMGLDEFQDEDVQLNLQVLLRDQQTVMEYHFDVGRTIQIYPEQRLLVIDVWPPINLPDVEPSDETPSGFEVDVTPWEEEEVVIAM